MLRCVSREALAALLGAVLIVSLIPAVAELNLSNSSYPTEEANKESVQVSMLKLPLSFIENRGQSPNDVKFLIKTSGQTVFFTPKSIEFALNSGNNSSIVAVLDN